MSVNDLAPGLVTLRAHDEMFHYQGVIGTGMTGIAIEEATATAMTIRESHWDLEETRMTMTMTWIETRR